MTPRKTLRQIYDELETGDFDKGTVLAALAAYGKHNEFAFAACEFLYESDIEQALMVLEDAICTQDKIDMEADQALEDAISARYGAYEDQHCLTLRDVL